MASAACWKVRGVCTNEQQPRGGREARRHLCGSLPAVGGATEGMGGALPAGMPRPRGCAGRPVLPQANSGHQATGRCGGVRAHFTHVLRALPSSFQTAALLKRRATAAAPFAAPAGLLGALRVPRALLVGHSAGALVAVEAALSLGPDRVAALALVAPALPTTREHGLLRKATLGAQLRLAAGRALLANDTAGLRCAALWALLARAVWCCCGVWPGVRGLVSAVPSAAPPASVARPSHLAEARLLVCFA